ncbi:hypothetical protein Ocin01_15955 [Orchesella cincta]|uniref:Uncharacterized protein n=1 Tax=Orchesella cincta TaxID=48709 RepID=A0A1D2MCJ7_ORCCI|nr:hypothetical protein Ocin01_15955 [Orchesella cincta]
MSSQKSSRKNKSSFGNGSYPPHMQSSLSPQGFGLYNSNGGSSTENSTSITSCFSPPNQQNIPCKDYLISNALPHNVVNAAGGDGLWNATGNENFTTFSTSGGSRVNGLSENGYEAMRRVDGGFGGSFPKPQEHSLSQAVPTTTMHQPPYQSPPKQYTSNETEPRISQRPPANVATIRAAGALGQKDFSSGSSSSINGNRGNQWVMPSMFDGENSSHETVNSSTAAPRFLPQSDLSGVSGFGISGGTNGKALVKSQLQPYYHQNNNANNTSARNSRSEDPEMDRDRKKDRLIDSLSNSDMITCLPGFKKRPDQIKSVRPNWPKTFGEDKVAPHMLRSPAVPSAYSRHSPPIPNYSSNRQIDGHAYNNNNSATMSNQVAGGSRPCSPISRAKAAIGLAQREFSKINSFVEAEADGRKPPGAWKNMGTPFLSEPQTKSAQRQQKAQYRMDLERQILASKMRKAEEERKEKDNNDHPLGPEYAHPALTYYNPPHKIMDQGGSSANPAATAALTKYIKEKYALDVSGANAIPATPVGYPQETGGSTTLSGRIGPLQQAKKEKALANLMKSRMHPRDQNQGSASRLPMNQLQTGGSKLHNGMMMQPGNSSRFAQQQQQSFGHTNLSKPQQPGFTQYPVPPGAYSSRPTAYGVPIPMPSAAGWPMPMYPAYAQAYGQVNPYGQPIYPSANRGPVNSQQGQHQQQQYSQPPSVPVQPPLQQGLHDPRSNQNSGIPSHAYQSQQQNYWQGQEKHKFAEEARFTQPPQMGSNSTNFQRREETYQADVDDDDDDDDDSDLDLVALKEKALSTQKIWQTSDELPDPELRTAIYKAELRKQIDEDRRRKAEKQAREKEEEERIEMKIREFHEEERRRIAMEQQTRAELEGYHRSKVERKQKRHEALTIRNRNQEEKVIRRPRSRSSVLAEKLARYGPEAGDFEEPYERDNRYNNRIIRTPQSYHEDEYRNEKLLSTSLAVALQNGADRPVRKASPPVPVVQRKLIESFLNDPEDSKSMLVRRQRSFDGQNFLLELKSKLSSERDLVERRLEDKLESTHKNMNLLKYTMNQK